MGKKILIVESDSAHASVMHEALAGRGFEVSETGDGKGSVELVRRERPDLVVLAVELSAGQNGYLICGKLKKDDELKTLPVVIVGSPDGFVQHRKLKTRADDYVAKPLDTAVLVERVGALIGLPEPLPTQVVDESVTLTELDEPLAEELSAEEISLTEELGTEAGDPELQLLDAAFQDLPAPEAPAAPEPSSFEEPLVSDLPVAGAEADGDFASIDSLGAEPDAGTVSLEPAEEPVVEAEPPRAPPPPPPPPPATWAASTPRPSSAAGDGAELRTLRARVAELQAALEDAHGQASGHEARARELEAELEGKAAELESLRASAGKSDRDTFALREAANRKDKENLRLKSELNEKEHELVELRDKLLALEQQTTESAAETARREAQLRTLTARAEGLAAERKKMDALVAAAREEARSAGARLAALQAEAEQASASQEGLQNELGELQGELDAVREQAQGQRAELEQAQEEARAAREQADRATDEAQALRRRMEELDEASRRHEERVTQLYGRIKTDEKVREKTKKALTIALQLLEEGGVPLPAALPGMDGEAAA